MNTISKIITRINEMRASNIEDKKIKAYLTLEDFTDADIAKAFKQLGGAKKKRGFAAEYYDWLSAETRTSAEANDYIMGKGEYGETSNNVKNHLSHYLNIWELSYVIWNKVGEPEVEAEPEVETEQESSEDEIRAEKIRQFWKMLKEAQAKYANGERVVKSRFHPDKVSYLKDDELTTAYKEFFQRLNTRKSRRAA